MCISNADTFLWWKKWNSVDGSLQSSALGEQTPYETKRGQVVNTLKSQNNVQHE